MVQNYAELYPSIAAAFQRGTSFILRQYDPARPGWSVEPDPRESDPWTTSQILYLMKDVIDVPNELIENVTAFLLDRQNPDGSWGSITYSSGGDVPASGNAVISLLAFLEPSNAAIQKGLDWIQRNYKQGWTTVPDDKDRRFTGTHYYSTATALRALCAAPRQELRSMCIQDALSQLKNAQVRGGGWSFSRGRKGDSTFTSYVLHGLFDAANRGFLTTSEAWLSRGLKRLVTMQASDGSWSDWHGVQQSPESTAYAVFNLVRSKTGQYAAPISMGLNQLLNWQHDDGGWRFDPNTSEAGNNWVTYTALLALKEVLANYQNDQVADEDVSPVRVGSMGVKTSGIVLPEGLKQYQTVFPDQLGSLPLVRPLDHTMFDSIDSYVKAKIPDVAVKAAIVRNGKIEVHGIYPEHFREVARLRGWLISEEIGGFQKPQNKDLNRVRPRFFVGQDEEGNKRFWIAVTPGRDYVHHYALMVRHIISLSTVEWKSYLRVYRYPFAERSITDWTKFSGLGLLNEDVIIIGYVDEVRKHLEEQPLFNPADTETEFYSRRRRRLNGRQVTLLGVKFSFWGSISGLIVNKICSFGCREIIYVGKLGALTSPLDVYSKVFSPSKFIQLHHSRIEYESTSPPNYLHEAFVSLDTGSHISVPTVLEEDYVQRGKADDIAASSIDNEICSMASAIASWNKENQQTVGFSCLHFATDYVRRPEERVLGTSFDLGNDKSDIARVQKSMMIDKISRKVLLPYLHTVLESN